MVNSSKTEKLLAAHWWGALTGSSINTARTPTDKSVWGNIPGNQGFVVNRYLGKGMHENSLVWVGKCWGMVPGRFWKKSTIV